MKRIWNNLIWWLEFWWDKFKLGNVYLNRQRAEHAERMVRQLEGVVAVLEAEAELMQAGLDNFQASLNKAFTEKQINHFFDVSDKLHNKESE